MGRIRYKLHNNGKVRVGDAVVSVHIGGDLGPGTVALRVSAPAKVAVNMIDRGENKKRAGRSNMNRSRVDGPRPVTPPEPDED